MNVCTCCMLTCVYIIIGLRLFPLILNLQWPLPRWIYVLWRAFWCVWHLVWLVVSGVYSRYVCMSVLPHYTHACMHVCLHACCLHACLSTFPRKMWYSSSHLYFSVHFLKNVPGQYPSKSHLLLQGAMLAPPLFFAKGACLPKSMLNLILLGIQTTVTTSNIIKWSCLSGWYVRVTVTSW